MNLKTYYNLQSTQAIFFIKHTSSLGREEASSSFNSVLARAFGFCPHTLKHHMDGKGSRCLE